MARPRPAAPRSASSCWLGQRQGGEDMTPKERVMTALRRGQPDQVPWVENEVEELLQIQIMGGRTDYTPGELCRALGMDGFGYHSPTGRAGAASQALQTSASMKE